MNIADTKFKVGDWIVYNRNNHSRKIMQIYDIRDNRYYFNDNIHFSWSVKECDEKSHLWTIKDAKNGDVLHSPSHHLIWIYKNSVQYHACVNTNYAQYYDFDTNGWLGIPKDVFPATKDEQTILFERIKRVGYEWDADEKELIEL